MPDRTFTHCKGKLFYFMSHENEETNYRKIKIEAFINYKSTISSQNNVLLGVTWMCPSKLKLVTSIEE